MDISYNVLNFPCRFYDIDSMAETSYIYLSDGSKRSAAMHDGLGKLYRGSFVYDSGSDVGSSVSLESVATPEGRLAFTTDGILDLWYAKDHLGNVRSVIDLASGVIEENDYLPFGTRIQDSSQPTMSDNRWRYANKEEQSSLVGGSCKLIDFGARNYDPWSARWTTIDPMAQKYTGMSPYNYCAGNPVMLVDADGRSVVIKGEAAQEFLADLQSIVGRAMELSLSDDGKLSFTRVKGIKMSREARLVRRIIRDRHVEVNILANHTKKTSTGEYMVGGAFMGNIVEGLNVRTFQEVNPRVLHSIDLSSDSPIGSTSLHELSESYEGGLISLENGTSSSNASIDSTVYKDAHGRAYPQPPVYEMAYDRTGVLLYPIIYNGKLTYLLSVNKIINYVKNKNGKETVIQVRP